MNEKKVAIATLLGVLFNKRFNNRLLEENRKTQKFVGYFELMDIWLGLMEANKNVSVYFQKNNYKKIAIYGAGKLGAHLFEQLKNSDIEISYFIDKRAVPFGNNIKVLSENDNLESVDVIVVTPVFDYKNVRQALKNKCNFKIVSIEDVVYETYEEL